MRFAICGVSFLYKNVMILALDYVYFSPSTYYYGEVSVEEGAFPNNSAYHLLPFSKYTYKLYRQHGEAYVSDDEMLMEQREGFLSFLEIYSIGLAIYDVFKGKKNSGQVLH